MSDLNIIGIEVESVFGSKKFLIIYFILALWGNIFSCIFSPKSIYVGESGAIFGLLEWCLYLELKK